MGVVHLQIWCGARGFRASNEFTYLHSKATNKRIKPYNPAWPAGTEVKRKQQDRLPC